MSYFQTLDSQSRTFSDPSADSFVRPDVSGHLARQARQQDLICPADTASESAQGQILAENERILRTRKELGLSAGAIDQAPDPTPTNLNLDGDGLIVRASAAPISATDIAEWAGGLVTTIFQPIDSARNLRGYLTLHDMITGLIETSVKSGQPLKEVRVASHGSAGTIYFPGGTGGSNSQLFNAVRLSDVKVLSEFARLRPYLTRNAKISFHGCEVASIQDGDGVNQSPVDGEASLQAVADTTGATVTAYKWLQSAVLPGYGPSVTKQGKLISVSRLMSASSQPRLAFTGEGYQTRQEAAQFLNNVSRPSYALTD